MHQLILLRHAKAARGNAALPDHDRPLTPDGKQAAAAMGAVMRGLGLTPDVVLVSSALRTRQTLDALEPWDDRPNVETLPALYMASYRQIRDILRETPETARSVLLIGHNPGIHDLAQLLAGDPEENPAGRATQPEFARLAEAYPTASLCEFLVTTSWRTISPAAGGPAVGGPAVGRPATPRPASGAALQRFIRLSDLPPRQG